MICSSPSLDICSSPSLDMFITHLSGPVTSTVNIGGSVAQLKPTVRDIGVVLDTRLDKASQVSSVCRSAYYHLFRIAKIRASLTIVACKTLVHAVVISRLDYGNALLYGITDRLLHRLDMIQHTAVRIIMCIKRHDRQSITAVLRRLHWLPVKWRINYKRIVVHVFRALHGLAPAYVSTLITPYEPRRPQDELVALCCVCLAITWNDMADDPFPAQGPCCGTRCQKTCAWRTH